MVAAAMVAAATGLARRPAVVLPVRRSRQLIGRWIIGVRSLFPAQGMARYFSGRPILGLSTLISSLALHYVMAASLFLCRNRFWCVGSRPRHKEMVASILREHKTICLCVGRMPRTLRNGMSMRRLRLAVLRSRQVRLFEVVCRLQILRLSGPISKSGSCSLSGRLRSFSSGERLLGAD